MVSLNESPSKKEGKFAAHKYEKSSIFQPQ